MLRVNVPEQLFQSIKSGVVTALLRRKSGGLSQVKIGQDLCFESLKSHQQVFVTITSITKYTNCRSAINNIGYTNLIADCEEGVVRQIYSTVFSNEEVIGIRFTL